MAKWQSLAVGPLRDGFQGDVLLPGDLGYDDARQIWNGMYNRRPAVVARCTGAKDIQRALRFAREQSLALSIKGGGHNAAGLAVVDDGLEIDLSPLRAVTVNAKAKTAHVEGGARLGDLDSETQRYGLAVPAGIISGTGVGGLTLGGGFGWISRKFGLTIDHLTSARVVTADGREVTASETENPDLFWGLRGGGGNFGIVTAFDYRCVELGTEVFSGLIVKRFEDLKELLGFYREYVRALPDDITVWMILRKAPPLPFLPASVHGQLVAAVAVVGVGKPEPHERHIQPVRDTLETLGEHLGMNPWVAWQSGFDGLVPDGLRNYWKSHDMLDLSDAVADRITEFMLRMPSDDSQVVIVHLEGAVGRVPETATAFPHRSVPFLVNIETRWQEAADDDACRSWAQDFHTALRPHAKGVYVNFLSEEGPERVREAYTPDVWQRLVQLKKQWDPDNVFRMNQNIRPA